MPCTLTLVASLQCHTKGLPSWHFYSFLWLLIDYCPILKGDRTKEKNNSDAVSTKSGRWAGWHLFTLEQGNQGICTPGHLCSCNMRERSLEAPFLFFLCLLRCGHILSPRERPGLKRNPVISKDRWFLLNTNTSVDYSVFDGMLVRLSLSVRMGLTSASMQSVRE